MSRPHLAGVSDIRAFFRTNETPVYFVSPTPFNLLGIDRWVRSFYYVSYYDAFDGTHPRVFVPSSRAHTEFESMEDVCNHLLADPEVIDFIRGRGRRGKATFVMFDEDTEVLAAEAGLEIAHPSAALRHRLDSKIVTTQLGNEAGVPSVPNTLGRATTYEELGALAARAALGDDLVVQTPYGDSGKTTFFIRSREDWDEHASEIVTQELKVMRRINNRAAACEAVLTRHGTVVGPLMMDLTGYPELTPYEGGWCGNDYPATLSEKQRERARVLTRQLGDRLATEGYRGFFEVDFLADTDTDELYLGELNPRISGITSMTNVTAGAYADMPLFLFHLLEYMDVDYDLDVDEINQRWSRATGVDVWSQAIIKETTEGVEQLAATPETGIWRMDSRGKASFARPAQDWHSIEDETEAFYLRILGPGEYRYPGADLGAFVTRGRLQTTRLTLTPRCRKWVTALRAGFVDEHANTPAHQLPPAPAAGRSLK